MAIIDSIRGLEISVEIEGQKATEYDDPSSEPELGDDEVRLLASSTIEDQLVETTVRDKERPHLVKYIEAKAGHAFKVRVIRRPHFKHLGTFITCGMTVDGNSSFGCNDSHLSKRRTWDKSIDGVYSYTEDDGYLLHLLRFGSRKPDPNGRRPTEDEKELGKHCGTILVKLHHIRSFGEDLVSEDKVIDTKSTELPEKALKGKAVSLVTEYKTMPYTDGVDERYFIHYDPKKRPFATFEFRYRKKEDLIKEGVIPRPTLQERVREMSQAALQEEVLRLHEEREVLMNKVKDEVKMEQDGTDLRGIKRERSETVDAEVASPTRYKERRLDNGKVEIEID